MSDDGVKIGLEIHQQLDTDTKLFCRCPTERRDPEETAHQVTRYMNATESELGEIDEAAAAETATQTEMTYLSYDTTCLVEVDEEPPHRINQDALETAVRLAQHFDMNVVDKMHVMRKIIVDGSMPSGFQRTALVGRDGVAETDFGNVPITDILLEEESGRVTERSSSSATYSLGRLGIPLIELGTAPVMSSPEEARTVAEHLGMVLRSTLNVKRGLGTIRQDVNVSIPEGARVEIKGVQQIDTLEDVVRSEIERQNTLVDIRDALQERGAEVGATPQDVTTVFENTKSSLIGDALDDGDIAVALRLDGYDSLLGREVFDGQTFGAELAAYAKKHGVDGLFHTDELPAYGVTDDEVAALRDAVDATDDDAVILIAADAGVAHDAIEAAGERASIACRTVPEETRRAHEDGTTIYMRPLSGAARMYPETDIPPVQPPTDDVEPIELLRDKAARYAAEYSIDESLAQNVAFGKYADVFEDAVDAGVEPSLAATTVVETLTELRRDDVSVQNLSDDVIRQVLMFASDDLLVDEGVGTLLRKAATTESPDLHALINKHNLEPVNEETIESVVHDVVDDNSDMIVQRGHDAAEPLMGQCMKDLRGRAEGETVRTILLSAIGTHLDEEE